MNTSNFKALTATAFFFSLCAFVTGCRHYTHESPGAGAAKSPTYTYKVRGIIEQLPAAGDTGRQISIKTQAIKNFIGPDDQPSPMPAMVMDYSAAKSVDMTSLHQYEKIEFTYRVNWQKGLNRISHIHELPAKTILDFHSDATGNMNTMPKGN